MLNKDVGSVPYIVLAVSAPHPTVSYVVLTWRMNELGGERHCRQWLKKLQRNGFIVLESDCRADRREKSVRVTNKGHELLAGLRNVLAAIEQNNKINFTNSRESQNSAESGLIVA